MAAPSRRSTNLPASRLGFPSLFGEEWPSLFGSSWPQLPSPISFAPDAPEPLRLEEYVEDATLVIRAEMPGIDPDRDVDITVHDGSLRIRATRRCERKDEAEGWIRSEFQYGSFTRVLALPAGASEDDVEAHYRDGILEIRVPLGAESPQARTVPVRRPD